MESFRIYNLERIKELKGEKNQSYRQLLETRKKIMEKRRQKEHQYEKHFVTMVFFGNYLKHRLEKQFSCDLLDLQIKGYENEMRVRRLIEENYRRPLTHGEALLILTEGPKIKDLETINWIASKKDAVINQLQGRHYNQILFDGPLLEEQGLKDQIKRQLNSIGDVTTRIEVLKQIRDGMVTQTKIEEVDPVLKLTLN